MSAAKEVILCLADTRRFVVENLDTTMHNCERRRPSLHSRASFHSHTRDLKQKDISVIIEFFGMSFGTKMVLFDNLIDIHDEPAGRPDYDDI